VRPDDRFEMPFQVPRTMASAMFVVGLIADESTGFHDREKQDLERANAFKRIKRTERRRLEGLYNGRDVGIPECSLKLVSRQVGVRVLHDFERRFARICFSEAVNVDILSASTDVYRFGNRTGFDSGFTLIELLVVIAIIAILAGMRSSE
jgi:prepilin-type N-terminal cleavage/methylation domain-containing protein